MPARSNRSMIFGEQLAGPMVHTIFECLKSILGFGRRRCALGRGNSCKMVFLFLPGAGKLRDNFDHYIDALGERREWNALIVAVHAL